MSERSKSTTEHSQEELVEELRDLGQNLKSIIQTAWESEERKKIQQDLESGLRQLMLALEQSVTDFRESPEGQRLKEEAELLRDRLRSGEATAKLRDELLAILQKVNEELKKAGSISSEKDRGG